MGLVKTRRLVAMQKQQRAKAGMWVNALRKVPSRFSAARGQDEVRGGIDVKRNFWGQQCPRSRRESNIT